MYYSSIVRGPPTFHKERKQGLVLPVCLFFVKNWTWILFACFSVQLSSKQKWLNKKYKPGDSLRGW